MARMKQSDIRSLQIILVLGVLGLGLSIYLVREHYVGGDGKSACDIAEHISCSAVLSSEYSELFSVPIAVFGVTWNLVLVLISLQIFQIGNEAKSEEKYSSPKIYMWIGALFLWIVAGIGFVFYLLAAEFILGAICPLCTIIHVFTAIEFYFSWKLFQSQTSTSISLDDIIDTFKYWIVAIAVIHLLLLIYFNIPATEVTTFEENKELAKCLTENKVFMYGSPKCSHCQSQKRIFGDAFEFVKFVNCDEEETECTKREIEGFPTWIQFDSKDTVITKFTGVRSVSALRKVFPQCAPKISPTSLVNP